MPIRLAALAQARRTAIALLLTCAAVPAAAQVTPPRDPGAAAKKGTGIIQGKVSTAEGRPLRRARVTLSTIGLGAEGRRTASTGLDGTYVFKELPAARYRVNVTRGGYLALEYGQRRPGEQGRPIQLAEGQKLERVDFVLPRMSGIIGRVTDENGEPIEGVSVYAMRSIFTTAAGASCPSAPCRCQPTTKGSTGFCGCRPARIR